MGASAVAKNKCNKLAKKDVKSDRNLQACGNDSELENDIIFDPGFDPETRTDTSLLASTDGSTLSVSDTDGLSLASTNASLLDDANCSDIECKRHNPTQDSPI